MSLNLSISNRLLLGFGVLTLVALISLFGLDRALVKNKNATITNTDIYTLSVTRLNALYEVVKEKKSNRGTDIPQSGTGF